MMCQTKSTTAHANNVVTMSMSVRLVLKLSLSALIDARWSLDDTYDTRSFDRIPATIDVGVPSCETPTKIRSAGDSTDSKSDSDIRMPAFAVLPRAPLPEAPSNELDG